MEIYKLAVLGNPIAHSLSPEIHKVFARQTGIELSYERLLVPENEFQATADRFLEEGGTGFNVTLPCKGDAYQFANQCSGSADRCKAVNTISVNSRGQTMGENTDGPGLVRDLIFNRGWKIGNQRVLVLGAGGAVRGVLWDLLRASPELIHLHNRTGSRAESVVSTLNVERNNDRLMAVDSSELSESYDLVINGTSAGLQGEVPDLPARILGPGTCCYDMVYGSSKTSFNTWCRDTANCEVADGLGMLVEQAALAFQIWFPETDSLDTAEVISSLRKNL